MILTSAFAIIKDWLEVWALLIPISVLVIKPKQSVYLKPVIYYLFVALLFNLIANLIWKTNFFNYSNNNPAYNLHSIFRLIFFSVFFIHLKQPFLTGVKLITPFIFIILLSVNFIYFEYFFQSKISTRLHTIESGVLLFYCMQYYLFRLKDEHASYSRMPDFWIVTGLSIFVVISFPIYLFYDPILGLGDNFVNTIWQVQKAAFLIFCIFIAKAFNTKEWI